MAGGHGIEAGPSTGNVESFETYAWGALSGPSAKDKLPWLAVVGWVVLSVVTASLLALAIYLLFRMQLFSDASLNDEQFKSLWAFLGVTLGTVATLIGALLTYQNQRRVNSLATEAERRQKIGLLEQTSLNKQAEQRLTLETRVKALELISTEKDYAPPARVAGAVATMMDLAGGPVTIRVLGELWAEEKVSTPAAVWMVDRVLKDESAPARDQMEAAFLLSFNAAKLIPPVDAPRQDWTDLPEVIADTWPLSLPSSARYSLLDMCARVLVARGRRYWEEENETLQVVVDALFWALDDVTYGTDAGLILTKLLDVGLRPWRELEDVDEQRIRDKAAEADATPLWLLRILEQLETWEEPVRSEIPPRGHPSPVAQDLSRDGTRPPVQNTETASGRSRELDT